MKVIKYFYLFILILIIVSGCEMKNNPVEIISLVSSDSIAKSRDTLIIVCDAQDGDGDKLSYEWQSTSGTILANRDSALWIAPNKSGYYQVTCKVLDGIGSSDVGSVTIQVVGGIISGTVTNAVNGLIIPGTLVVLDSDSTFSDENGQYEFYLSLENSSYEVHSSIDSFCPYEGSFIIPYDYSSSLFIYNFSMSPIPEPGEIRMVLNWGENPRDLDSHLKTPQINGQEYHIMYSNRGSSESIPFVTLDVDDTNGYGPETITIKQAYDGTYLYYIYKYSSIGTFSESGASIQIFNSPDCDGERIQVPIDGSGRYWYVCDINGGDGTINVINRVQNSEPSF